MVTKAAQSPVVRVSEPAEVLSYIPHAIGYLPTDSLVAISLRAPRRRIGLVARVDVADVTGEHGCEVADDLADFLRSDGAVALFVVVYTNEPLAQARSRQSVTDRAFEALMCAQGLPESVETWIVAPDGYAAWGCEDSRCCPPQGRDLRDLDDTRLATQLTLAGSAPLASRADLQVGLDADERRGREFAGGARRIVRSRVQALERGDLARWRVQRASAVLTLLTGRQVSSAEKGSSARAAEEALSPTQLGAIAAALTDVLVRDLVLVAIARTCSCPDAESGATQKSKPGGPQAVRISAASLASLPDDVGVVFGAGGPSPEPERVRGVQQRIAEVVRLSRGPMRADALVVLSWLAWWAGDGARAGVHLKEALDLVPDHRLGALIRDSLRHAVPPGWARAAG